MLIIKILPINHNFFQKKSFLSIRFYKIIITFMPEFFN